MKYYLKKVVVGLFRIFHSNVLIHTLKKWNELAQLPAFKYLGVGTSISKPFFCGNANYIEIGKNCHIGMSSDFSIAKQNGSHGNISLGDNVWITARCQIFSLIEVRIDDDVMIASNVFISDYSHGYKYGNIPYKEQPYEPSGAVHIGKGAWIGQNVVILQGVTIGKQCIIGANSIVRDSIPHNCIAAGVPARVIQVWDVNLNKWVKVIDKKLCND